MRNYIHVVEGVVIGVQSSMEKIVSQQLIEVDDDKSQMVGKLYKNGKFSDKAKDAVRVITPDAMQDRFTYEEKVKIVASAKPEVKVFYDDLRFRTRPVNLNSKRFRLAMNLLLVENCIDVGRDLALLADGTPDEAY